MKKSIFYTFGLALAAIAFASCDDFLDKMPDSRAELDTEEKVVKMLVSAYPDNTYNMCAEFSSDNVDDYGSIKSYNQLQEELYNWQEVSSVETNENPNAVWGDAYTAIAAANQALAAIEELAVPRQPSSRPPKARRSSAAHTPTGYWSTCSACITTPTTRTTSEYPIWNTPKPS